MAGSMNKFEDDCILIEDDDEDDRENIHEFNHKQDDDDIEIVFDSASSIVLNKNNNHNYRKRPYSALNETKNNENRMAVIDLTDDDDEYNENMRFRSRILKDFPGLCIDLINGLNFYNRLQENEKTERLKQLEKEVRKITSLSIGMLEAWLIKKTLILQNHHCERHRNSDGTRVKMTLIQCNVSGGSIFKWSRPCCSGERAISTMYFRGFFDGQLSPKSILHLLYDWITLTKPLQVAKDLQNVPLSSIHKLYCYFRAVCTSAIHEHFEKLGGQRRAVEVCLMYVGVKDNAMKRLKIVIVGAYDVTTKKRIILSLPPISLRSNSTSLDILSCFIDQQSVIVIDRTVSKSLFTNVGFQNVYYPFIDGGIPVNNSKVIQLTRSSLHIFDASLSSLSTAQIQLCLNELMWREEWGTHSLSAYNKFLAHVSELTRTVENFKTLSAVHSVLDAIVANPHEHWRYSRLECCSTNCSTTTNHPAVSTVQSTTLNKSAINRSLTESTTLNKSAINRSLTESTTLNKSAINRSLTESTAEEPSSVSVIEPYYYGTYSGDEVISSEADFSVSCHLCAETFYKNDLFIEHLIQHSLNKTGFNRIRVCTVCLKSFSNEIKLRNHITNFHKNKPSETSCLICDEDFSYRLRLLEHMKDTHSELELPFRCGLCNFMCSEQKHLSKHYSSFHNQNRSIWCPVCFKIFVIEPEQDKLLYDLNNFTQHILRHLQKPFVEKCPKCSLNFIHAVAMKDHLENDHGSCKNKMGIVRHSSIVTERDSRIVRDRNQKSGSARHNSKVLTTIVKMYNTIPIQRLDVFGLSPSSMCIECEGPLTHHKFNSRFNCKKCTYSTFCEQAVRYHVMDIHIKEYSRHSLLKFRDNSLSCSCGYLSKYNNKMAKHFSSCKVKLLYGYNENVVNNFIVSSVILKKSVTNSQMQSTPSVLLSVGLIKR
ncbi:uncharacterized protein LOC111051317 isoform X3 [Nilaparvata lugens]|uniref:uncharacterized protein LOC111051317 isoform X2 n=1 Tax=Nilaparvata lugens TaxID=108931 RepID=UPI00193D72E2|nr:uncharacterized protein LOC111051317 isoform X2 [Nilaparvata lugens]XP_039285423.1 uncharacterized protein LOC111051317 isoform X3 [Nilaparvata lugens]